MSEHEFEYSQAIIIRKDIQIPKGKLAVQAAHASIGAYIKTQKTEPQVCNEWFVEGQRKVALKVDNLVKLLLFKQKAELLNIPTYLVEDFGFTVFHGQKTVTCIGIGPIKKSQLDELIEELKLY